MSPNKNLNEFLKKIKDLRLKKEINDAFQSVDRSIFFDPFFRDKINSFAPIPVGFGEHSDDVQILTKMLTVLSPHKKWEVLEIGTGSGYSTAILASMVKRVVTIEYHEKLAVEAKERLIANGFFNVKFLAGDFSELDDSAGHFDAAIIHAGCIHSPYAALNLLKKNGIAVFCMGTAMMQQITLYKNIIMDDKNPFLRYKFFDTCKVPSIKGRYGYSNPELDIIVETGRGDA
jgi:protein-L-isoaspartate(D-aspartate) O-methyltransferase